MILENIGVFRTEVKRWHDYVTFLKCGEVGIEKPSSERVNMLPSHQICGHRCQGFETTPRFVLASGTPVYLISILIEMSVFLSFVKEASGKWEVPPSYMAAVQKNSTMADGMIGGMTLAKRFC